MIGLLKTEYTCLQILNFKQTRQLRHDNVDFKNNQFYKIAIQSLIIREFWFIVFAFNIPVSNKISNLCNPYKLVWYKNRSL